VKIITIFLSCRRRPSYSTPTTKPRHWTRSRASSIRLPVSEPTSLRSSLMQDLKFSQRWRLKSLSSACWYTNIYSPRRNRHHGTPKWWYPTTSLCGVRPQKTTTWFSLILTSQTGFTTKTLYSCTVSLILPTCQIVVISLFLYPNNNG
jgi:hypothetical protein